MIPFICSSNIVRIYNCLRQKQIFPTKTPTWSILLFCSSKFRSRLCSTTAPILRQSESSLLLGGLIQRHLLWPSHTSRGLAGRIVSVFRFRPKEMSGRIPCKFLELSPKVRKDIYIYASFWTLRKQIPDHVPPFVAAHSWQNLFPT